MGWCNYNARFIAANLLNFDRWVELADLQLLVWVDQAYQLPLAHTENRLLWNVIRNSNCSLLVGSIQRCLRLLVNQWLDADLSLASEGRRLDLGWEVLLIAFDLGLILWRY